MTQHQQSREQERTERTPSVASPSGAAPASNADVAQLAADAGPGSGVDTPVLDAVAGQASAPGQASPPPGQASPPSDSVDPRIVAAQRRAELAWTRDELARRSRQDDWLDEMSALDTSWVGDGQDQAAAERAALEERARVLQEELDSSARSSGKLLDRSASATYAWGEDGLEREEPERPDPAKAKVAPRVASSRSLGHDFSPEFVAETNAEIATWCAAHKADLEAWIGTWFPGVPPTVTLEGKIVLGQVGVKTKNEGVQDADNPGAVREQRVADTDESLVQASLELKAEVGMVGKASQLAIAFGASPEVFHPTQDFSIGGETFTAEAVWDLTSFLGVRSSAKLSIGTGERINEGFARLVGLVRDETEAAAQEQVVDPAQAAAATQGEGVPKAPADEKKEESKPLLAGGVEGSVFAGVEAKASAEAGVTWQKKHASAYADRLQELVRFLAELVGTDEETVAGYLEDQETEHTVAGWVFGEAAPASLFKAKMEGAVQAGASAAGALSFQAGWGQPVKFTVAGQATLGLGGSASTSIEADPFEIARVALATAGYFADPEVQVAIGNLAAHVWRRMQDLPGLAQITDDDRAREVVQQGGHEEMDHDGRRDLVDRMLAGATLDDDEEQILTLLDDSGSRGGFDLSDLIDEVGFFRLVNSVHGPQWTRLAWLLERDYYPQASNDALAAIVSRMAGGVTADWHQRVIADILTSTSEGTAGAILDQVGFYRAICDVGGGHWSRLRGRLRGGIYAANRSSLGRWAKELLDGYTPDWAREEVVCMLEEAGNYAEDIVAYVGFEDLWDELSTADVNRLEPVFLGVYRSMDTEQKIEAVDALIEVPCTELDQKHIIEIMRTTDDAAFTEMREQVGVARLYAGLWGGYYSIYETWVEALG